MCVCPPLRHTLEGFMCVCPPLRCTLEGFMCVCPPLHHTLEVTLFSLRRCTCIVRVMSPASANRLRRLQAPHKVCQMCQSCWYT